MWGECSLSSLRLPWLVRDKEFYKKLAMLALPMAAQNVISFGVNLADNLMVATLGEEAVSGIFFVNQISNILHMLVMGLGGALVVLAAQYYGKGDIKSVKTIIAIAMRLSIVVGIIVFGLMFFFGRPVLSLLTNLEPVIVQGVSYVKIVAWSYLLFCVTQVLLAGLRCAGVVKVGLYVSIAALIINIVFNYIFIFGVAALGIPAMGVNGAAIATLIARVIEFAIAAGYALFVDQRLRLRVKDILLHNTQLLKDFIRYGFPIILGDIFWGFGGAAQAAILGRMSSAVVAASSLAANMHQIFGVFVYGTAGAGSLTVGQTIGRNEFDLAKQYTKTLQLVYICIGVVSGLLMFFLRDFTLLLFPDLEQETLRITSQFMLVMSFTLVGTSYQMSTLQIVKSGGATHFVLVNDLIFVWLVVIPSAYIALNVFGAPAWVVFLCLKSDQVLKCAVAVVKVNRFKWMKNLTRTTEVA
jgi:putative MATE family efflux protein